MMGNSKNSGKLILGLIPSVLISCTQGTQENQSENKPNIIFILADDMGYGDLSCLGQKSFNTPSLDRMASEGIMFRNFYTGSTVSAPSRASLLTGKHTGHTSVRGNQPDQLLGDDEPTLAKVMKQSGYTTGCIGKWGIGHPPPEDDPAKKGFDYFFGYLNMFHAHNLYPEYLYRNGEKVFLRNKLRLIDSVNPWAGNGEGAGVAEVRLDYAPFLIDGEALSFIEKNKDNKFFLYLAYNVPHANNEKKPDGMEVPDYGEFENREWPDQEKGFAAMMHNIDNSVGAIFSKLKELEIDDKTLVIFCSDNGPHQEGGHMVDFFNSNGEWRGKKRDMYEGGVRTPFIARWPGKINPGSSSDHVAAFWDVLPTFCDIAGIKKPSDTDGISFLPSLKGEKQMESHEYLYWEFFEQGGKQAILKGDWKAVRLNVSKKGEKPVVELYNIKEDPAETNDVSSDHPELIKEFSEIFVKARQEFEIAPLFPAF